MKISAIICEFNPLHNGHEYLISQAKAQTDCEAVVCVMSGGFTQRGEMSVLDKYLRAKHAVLCGADAVLELPAPFAVAPAEIFAKGAVKIINSVGADYTLVFGCEGCENDDILKAARLALDESADFKRELAARLDGGDSFIKSYAAAFEAVGGNPKVLSRPNNVLGVEYVKAMLSTRGGADFIAVARTDGGYNDESLCGKYASAKSIRKHPGEEIIKNFMPKCSYDDFKESADNSERFYRLAADFLYLCDKENLKRVFGCGEGLENALKNLAFGNGYAQIISAATSKRYSSARISRILCANLLGLYADETERFLSCDLPIKVLAVKKERADSLLPMLSASFTPSPDAQKCWELNSRAYGLWRYLNTPLSYDNEREKMILV